MARQPRSRTRSSRHLAALLPLLAAVALASAPLRAAADKHGEKGGVPLPSRRNCTIAVGSKQVGFDFCVDIPDVGNAFVLAYSQLANRTRWGLSSASDSGYVSVGLASEPGEMVGATAWALQGCSSCASGAQLVEYFLAGTASGQVNPTADSLLLGLEVAAADGSMAATFDLPTDASASLPLIFASGAVYSNGFLRYHDQWGWGNLVPANASLLNFQSENKAISSLVWAHGWLNAIGWGVFVPAGIVMAHSYKHENGLWFKAHRIIMPLGWIMGVVGLGLGFAVSGGWEGRFAVHRNLGLAAVILGACQLTALVYRPKPYDARRRAWNLLHWSVGASAAILAIANIYYGLIDVQDCTWGWITYTVVFALIASAGLVKDAIEYLRLPPPGAAPDAAAAAGKPTDQLELTSNPSFVGTGA